MTKIASRGSCLKSPSLAKVSWFSKFGVAMTSGSAKTQNHRSRLAGHALTDQSAHAKNAMVRLGRAKKISCLSSEIFDEIRAGGRIFFLILYTVYVGCLSNPAARCSNQSEKGPDLGRVARATQTGLNLGLHQGPVAWATQPGPDLGLLHPQSAYI